MLSKTIKATLIIIAVLVVIGVIVWQAVTTSGTPNPAASGLSPAAMVLSTGVLVFREGLEAILVLATITAGINRSLRQDYLRAIPVGALIGILATVATWFIVAAIIADVNASELDIQAATGLLAIVVLLIVMNWFFHHIYWTGWIVNHSKRRRRLLEAAKNSAPRTIFGLVFLGFTSIYREGFEVVLFLQNLRLKAGNEVILVGSMIGLGLTLIVAALTFIAHTHLPYKKMLIITGVMLGVVLLVMVGESVQEMQQAGWIPTTEMGIRLPGWLGVWFSIFPNVETFAAQAVAVLLVIGSYISVPYVRARRPRQTAISVADTENTTL